MTPSIGANLCGFIVGGSAFYLQLLISGALAFVRRQPEADALVVAPYAILGIFGVFFLLVALYWLSSVLIVFPAFFVFRAIGIPAPVAAITGGAVAGLITWGVLRSPGVGNNMHGSLYFSCLSSAIMTGTATGFTLARLILNAEKMTPGKLAVETGVSTHTPIL